jgi:hypothetical protein
VVVRIHPAPFPLETKAAESCHVLHWLRQRGRPERKWHGWCRWEGRRYAVRSVAAKLEAAATRRARRRACRKAHKAGRTIMAPALAAAGWVWHITTRQAQYPREEHRVDQPPLAFWSLSTPEMLQQLQATQAGLTGAEATQRLARYGSNLLKPHKRSECGRSYWRNARVRLSSSWSLQRACPCFYEILSMRVLFSPFAHFGNLFGDLEV